MHWFTLGHLRYNARRMYRQWAAECSIATGRRIEIVLQICLQQVEAFPFEMMETTYAFEFLVYSSSTFQEKYVVESSQLQRWSKYSCKNKSQQFIGDPKLDAEFFGGRWVSSIYVLKSLGKNKISLQFPALIGVVRWYCTTVFGHWTTWRSPKLLNFVQTRIQKSLFKLRNVPCVHIFFASLLQWLQWL